VSKKKAGTIRKERSNFLKMANFLKKISKNFLKKKPDEDLKEMLKKGLLSKEEFLRFTIVRKQISLEKSKIELKSFLKKVRK